MQRPLPGCHIPFGRNTRAILRLDREAEAGGTIEPVSCPGDASGRNARRDHHFGRRLADNEEIEDAPESAHVKRTAQESFDPEAFVLRRSMPWMMSMQAGLMFVAFGKSFDAFEAQMRRMAGYDDAIHDAMFKISKPVTGAYFWCPPMRDGRLDLRQLGL